MHALEWRLPPRAHVGLPTTLEAARSRALPRIWTREVWCSGIASSSPSMSSLRRARAASFVSSATILRFCVSTTRAMLPLLASSAGAHLSLGAFIDFRSSTCVAFEPSLGAWLTHSRVFSAFVALSAPLGSARAALASRASRLARNASVRPALLRSHKGNSIHDATQIAASFFRVSRARLFEHRDGSSGPSRRRSRAGHRGCTR
jgi:hypothetical protein